MSLEKEKILVVDDDIAVIDSIISIYDEYDYYVTIARNGRQALEVLNSSVPDVIITDWEMPVMNGIEFVQKIREIEDFRSIPVIMITGIMGSMSNLKLAFETGVTDFISKPIDSVELIARTRSMLLLAGYHKEVIKSKELELTYLVKDIAHQNEFNSKLISTLESFRNNNIKAAKDCEILNKIIASVRQNIQEQSWTDFERQFSIAYPNFKDRLLDKYPKLTKNDIRLCVMLKLNMNSKEIAGITFQNPESVDIARYRLRKKLDLKRSENLQSFLLQF